MVKRWIPLEANPQVLDEYAASLGVCDVFSEYMTHDVLGLDPDLLSMVPQPALAVILLYPLTEASEAKRKEELAKAVETGGPNHSLYYMKQTIGNACGTIALLHAIGNNRHHIKIKEDSFLDKFFKVTESMSPAERGTYLENPPDGGPSIDEIHEKAAMQGDTEAPSVDEEINLHFVTFIRSEGKIWELDGRRAGPICHGEGSKGTLLEDVAWVVQREYIEKADTINFSLMAIGPGDAC